MVSNSIRLKSKDVLRDLAPPIIWHTLRRLGTVFINKSCPEPRAREWEYIREGWTYTKTHPEVTGWNVPDILEVSKRKLPKFKAMVENTGPLGISSESGLNTNINIHAHNTIMSFAYAITLAARRSESLSMLDWGGGIGHYYLLAKALLANVAIDYHCKDMPLQAEYGARLFPQQHFYTDESCLEQRYDFVMSSGSLHYNEDWQGILDGLARATQGYLYITRLPVVFKASSFVFVQRPYSYGYNTEYLGWCLNRIHFLNKAEKVGLILVREFAIGESPLIDNAPEQCQYMGFLFRPSPVE